MGRLIIVLFATLALLLAGCSSIPEPTEPTEPNLAECANSAEWVKSGSEYGLLMCQYFFPIPQPPRVEVSRNT